MAKPINLEAFADAIATKETHLRHVLHGSPDDEKRFKAMCGATKGRACAATAWETIIEHLMYKGEHIYNTKDRLCLHCLVDGTKLVVQKNRDRQEFKTRHATYYKTHETARKRWRDMQDLRGEVNHTRGILFAITHALNTQGDTSGPGSTETGEQGLGTLGAGWMGTPARRYLQPHPRRLLVELHAHHTKVLNDAEAELAEATREWKTAVFNMRKMARQTGEPIVWANELFGDCGVRR